MIISVKNILVRKDISFLDFSWIWLYYFKYRIRSVKRTKNTSKKNHFQLIIN
jgi:hypothetical protein